MAALNLFFLVLAVGFISAEPPVGYDYPKPKSTSSYDVIKVNENHSQNSFGQQSHQFQAPAPQFHAQQEYHYVQQAPVVHHQYSAPAVHRQYSAPAVHQQYSAPAVHQQYSAPAVHQQYSAPAVHQQYSAPAVQHHVQHAPAAHQQYQYSAPAVQHHVQHAPAVHQYSAPAVQHHVQHAEQSFAPKPAYKTKTTSSHSSVGKSVSYEVIPATLVHYRSFEVPNSGAGHATTYQSEESHHSSAPSVQSHREFHHAPQVQSYQAPQVQTFQAPQVQHHEVHHEVHHAPQAQTFHAPQVQHYVQEVQHHVQEVHHEPEVHVQEVQSFQAPIPIQETLLAPVPVQSTAFHQEHTQISHHAPETQSFNAPTSYDFPVQAAPKASSQGERTYTVTVRLADESQQHESGQFDNIVQQMINTILTQESASGSGQTQQSFKNVQIPASSYGIPEKNTFTLASKETSKTNFKAPKPAYGVPF